MEIEIESFKVKSNKNSFKKYLSNSVFISSLNLIVNQKLLKKIDFRRNIDDISFIRVKKL